MLAHNFKNGLSTAGDDHQLAGDVWAAFEPYVVVTEANKDGAKLLVFIDGSFAFQNGQGEIRAALLKEIENTPDLLLRELLEKAAERSNRKRRRG